MIDTTISKNKSLALKFLAAIFIIFTHMFVKVGQVNSLKYIPLFSLNGYPIEQYIGSFSGICVGMFIFLSGYGLYISYNKNIKYKEILKRIKKIYVNYWIILIIFLPIGMYMGVYKFEIKDFILNILGLRTSYNHPAWFLRLYVMLLIVYPMLIKLINRYNKNTILVVSFITNIIGIIITKIYYMSGKENIIIDLISILLGGQFLFIFGIIIAKYGIFDKVNSKIRNNKILYYILFIIIVILITVMIDISVIGEISKFILIP
ncbi:acyltransferase, partial [Clostridium perfringens]